MLDLEDVRIILSESVTWPQQSTMITERNRVLLEAFREQNPEPPAQFGSCLSDLSLTLTLKVPEMCP